MKKKIYLLVFLIFCISQNLKSYEHWLREDWKLLPVIYIDGFYRLTNAYCDFFFIDSFLELPTDIEEIINIENDLLIYPNPASDFITIQTSEFLKTSEVYNMQIFDVLGIEVGQISLIDGNNRINISQLPTGVYYIRIGDKTQKFVKM